VGHLGRRNLRATRDDYSTWFASVLYGLVWNGLVLAWPGWPALLTAEPQTTSAAHVKMERIKTREIAIVL